MNYRLLVTACLIIALKTGVHKILLWFTPCILIKTAYSESISYLLILIGFRVTKTESNFSATLSQEKYHTILSTIFVQSAIYHKNKLPLAICKSENMCIIYINFSSDKKCLLKLLNNFKFLYDLKQNTHFIIQGLWLSRYNLIHRNCP